jgi:hypothetical protein
MSASTAIGMVSESLRNLLVGEMILSPLVNVTILAPDESGGDRRINLFLYKVQEHPALKNLDWQVKQGEPRNSTAHEFLGDAMRVFYENPIVPEDYLVEGLKDATEQIKIVQNSLDLEELSKVWSTFTEPFRLSVLYEVSVVQLDMLSESERTMAQRVRQIGVPDVRAPFNPPVVENMEPLNGPIGTVVTFHGKNLIGWRAYVTIMRQLILDGEELTEDLFTVTIPDDLPAGFHEIRVDISRLYRRTFFFEVTT